MKWFKHESDASMDAKLKKVLIKYGAEGYGLYWYCLELIAAPIDKHNITFELEHDIEILAHELRMDSQRVTEIMQFMVDQNLFGINESSNRITCLKLAARIENSVVKNPQLKELQQLIASGKFPDKSGQNETIPDNPGQSGKSPARLDKTRLEGDKGEQVAQFPPKNAVALKTYRELLKAHGEQAFRDDDPIYEYAKSIELPSVFLRLCWHEFNQRYGSGDRKTKRYKDWRGVFRNCVRENWFGLWYLGDDGYGLTTKGKQAQRAMEANA